MRSPFTTKLAYAWRRFVCSDAMYSHTFNLGSSIVWLEAVPKGASRDQFAITLHSFGRDADQSSAHHYKRDLFGKGSQVKASWKEAKRIIRDWETYQLNDLSLEPTPEARFKWFLKTQIVTRKDFQFSALTGKSVYLPEERKREIENHRLSQRPHDIEPFAQAGIAELEKLLQRSRRPKRGPNNSRP